MFRWLAISGICLSDLSNGSRRRSLETNFVIIPADDPGYGDLGCFGHPQIKTPHLISWQRRVG